MSAAASEERGSVGYERTVAFSDGVFAIAITLLRRAPARVRMSFMRRVQSA
jgi:hypothetical protein